MNIKKHIRNLEWKFKNFPNADSFIQDVTPGSNNKIITIKVIMGWHWYLFESAEFPSYFMKFQPSKKFKKRSKFR